MSGALLNTQLTLFDRSLLSVLYVLLCEYVLSCSAMCNSLRLHEPGSSVYGILQARILEWVAIFFFRGSS